MTDKGKLRLAGAAAGAVNGLFGGGGGMILLPALMKWGEAEKRSAFATCLAAIYPMCCVSAAVAVYRLRPDMGVLVPYLAGGTAGGILAGLTMKKVPLRVLKIVFALFLIYGGVRYLL